MNILYISVLASQVTLNEVLQINPNSAYSPAAQKFNRLIAEGIAGNGEKITALSSFFAKTKGFIWHHDSEIRKGVRYDYIPTPIWGPLRYIALLFYSFVYVLFWGLKGRKNNVVVCDVLNVSACIGAVCAARIIGLRRVGIVTDLPGQMIGGIEEAGNRRSYFKIKMNKSFLNHFTHYVVLTEKMNEVVNINHRPFIVMEGLVDLDMQASRESEKIERKVILYAGGLHERYGLKLLVEGFIRADVSDFELWIYGNGPFSEVLQDYCKHDSRIVYKGARPNNEVVDAELMSSLLVNPRPTHEEFTKFSFPSKNMEYMVSGTPVLTTMLPGMPQEYYPFVYLFDQGETVEGYAKVLRHVLSLPKPVLQNKGMQAREWVLKNKNHISQTARICDLLCK